MFIFKINTNKFSNTRLHRISKHKLGPIHSVKNTFVKISNDESSAARISGNIKILSWDELLLALVRYRNLGVFSVESKL